MRTVLASGIVSVDVVRLPLLHLDTQLTSPSEL